MSRRRTPAEKKRLSYKKDRRNDYGENSKASRRSIRRRKRFVNRANRRRSRTDLSRIDAPMDGELAELRLAGRAEKRWEKSPDRPLGEYVQQRLRRRADLGIDDEADVRRKLQRVRRQS